MAITRRYSGYHAITYHTQRHNVCSARDKSNCPLRRTRNRGVSAPERCQNSLLWALEDDRCTDIGRLCSVQVLDWNARLLVPKSFAPVAAAEEGRPTFSHKAELTLRGCSRTLRLRWAHPPCASLSSQDVERLRACVLQIDDDGDQFIHPFIHP